MSYKELDAFKKKVEGINVSIAKLEEKKAAQVTKRAKAGQEREDMLIAEALLGKEPDERQLEKHRKTIEACDEEIAEIDGRIALIEVKRAEALAPELPAIIKGRYREIDGLKREADAQFYDARKILCEYLLALQKVGITREKANALHRDFLHHALMVDPEEYSRVGADRHPLPDYLLFDDYVGLKLGIREADQKAALNGYVEPYVTQYQITGELKEAK